MAKTKPGKKDLDSYGIKGTNKIVRRMNYSLSSSQFYSFLFFIFKSLHSHVNSILLFLSFFLLHREGERGVVIDLSCCFMPPYEYFHFATSVKGVWCLGWHVTTTLGKSYP